MRATPVRTFSTRSIRRLDLFTPSVFGPHRATKVGAGIGAGLGTIASAHWLAVNGEGVEAAVYKVPGLTTFGAAIGAMIDAERRSASLERRTVFAR